MTEKLLSHIARGEQKEAEGMIKADPILLLMGGKVIDYSGRVFEGCADFKGIKPFQLAFWGDRQMWRMIQNTCQKMSNKNN